MNIAQTTPVPTKRAPTQPIKDEATSSRLPHRVAALLVVMVFPLIWLGGLVTTYDAGMAVPDWPGTYGYNMFLYPPSTWLFGPFDLLVEHGHRLLASLAGLVSIALVVVTFRKEDRTWVKWFSVGLLLLVIAQGLLGGLRVLMDARTLAKIHGCVGPAFFAGATAFCVVTSRWWRNANGSATLTADPVAQPSRWMTRIAFVMLAACYGQLILGALVRHIAVDARPAAYRGLIILHVTVACLIIAGTLFQWFQSRKARYRSSGIRSSINIVGLLILTQFGLGLGTWVVKFGWPVWFADYHFAASFTVGEKTYLQMNLITAHVAVGSLILAFWTIHLLRCRRHLSLSMRDTV